MKSLRLVALLLSVTLILAGCTPFWLEQGTPFEKPPAIIKEESLGEEAVSPDPPEEPNPPVVPETSNELPPVVVPEVPKNDTVIQQPDFVPIVVIPDEKEYVQPPIGHPMTLEEHRYYLQIYYDKATNPSLSEIDQKIAYAEAAEEYSRTIPTYPMDDVFKLMLPLALDMRDRQLHLQLDENEMLMMERIMLAQLGVRTFTKTKGETQNPLYHYYLFSAGSSLLVYANYLHIATNLEEEYRLLDLHLFRSGYAKYYFPEGE